jgi:hypothetical protein
MMYRLYYETSVSALVLFTGFAVGFATAAFLEFVCFTAIAAERKTLKRTKARRYSDSGYCSDDSNCDSDYDIDYDSDYDSDVSVVSANSIRSVGSIVTIDNRGRRGLRSLRSLRRRRSLRFFTSSSSSGDEDSLHGLQPHRDRDRQGCGDGWVLPLMQHSVVHADVAYTPLASSGDVVDRVFGKEGLAWHRLREALDAGEGSYASGVVGSYASALAAETALLFATSPRHITSAVQVFNVECLRDSLGYVSSGMQLTVSRVINIALKTWQTRLVIPYDCNSTRTLEIHFIDQTLSHRRRVIRERPGDLISLPLTKHVYGAGENDTFYSIIGVGTPVLTRVKLTVGYVDRPPAAAARGSEKPDGEEDEEGEDGEEGEEGEEDGGGRSQVERRVLDEDEDDEDFVLDEEETRALRALADETDIFLRFLRGEGAPDEGNEDLIETMMGMVNNVLETLSNAHSLPDPTPDGEAELTPADLVVKRREQFVDGLLEELHKHNLENTEKAIAKPVLGRFILAMADDMEENGFDTPEEGQEDSQMDQLTRSLLRMVVDRDYVMAAFDIEAADEADEAVDPEDRALSTDGSEESSYVNSDEDESDDTDGGDRSEVVTSRRDAMEGYEGEVRYYHFDVTTVADMWMWHPDQLTEEFFEDTTLYVLRDVMLSDERLMRLARDQLVVGVAMEIEFSGGRKVDFALDAGLRVTHSPPRMA